jgi:undecaprenyl diphosphate synthase
MNLDQLKKIDKDKLPKHLGLILDGNRRWARKHNINPTMGHLEGFKTLKKMLFSFFEVGIRYMTIYALSLENVRKRSEKELKYIYKLIIKAVETVLNEPFVTEEQVKFNILGRLSLLPKNVRDEIDKLIEYTKDFDKAFLNVCIMYDGQEEIVDAVKEILKDGLTPDDININTIKKHLYTRDLPEADYIIRTGMEDGARISGFLLWDSSYAEFRFRDEYWPDYNEKMMVEDLLEFVDRNRRKGE